MDDNSAPQTYRVLARKYRPRSFAELIGQDAMVRTLTNAIAADRLPHAFILTGVRGVGKTSTARIIARSLNCIGADGTGGPTVDPCGVCEHCTAIAEDRHVDVIEMDAASRTGVNDIRELIEGVRYRPVNARYKIYIIDEVHMLSTSAFNALLKTLEEPPEHVKFIFATTETRKVPVTVLSRCQRFDLRRVETDILIAHFAHVAKQENSAVSDGALALIARAADGSVRDGLSLLDQAIAHAGGEVTEAAVRDMLGLADGGRIYDLYEAAMKGTVPEALDIFTELYNAGADPAVILQDLLQVTHWLTRVKLAPEVTEGQAVPEIDRVRGKALAEPLALPVLGRTWQLLLKGLEEVRMSPSASQAAEMVLIRLAYMADLPSPADIIRKLQASDSGAATPSPSPASAAPVASAAPAAPDLAPAQSSEPAPPPSDGPGFGPTASLPIDQPPTAMAVGGSPEPSMVAQHQPSAAPGPELASFEDVIALFDERREPILRTALFNYAHLVQFEAGHIAIRVEPAAPSDLATRVSRLLSDWTGMQWLVSLSTEPGAPTLREVQDAREAERVGTAVSHPLVQAALSAFPGATVEAVHDHVETPLMDDGDPDSLSDDDDESDET
ncbi:MAG: DNA polymerase III subunit gamma/tau [Rhodospirillaceae bacterium]|jgi:DNA polymerase III subunit gamma/tau|nr:DNA polymerase III subunit gamma/tau [Rhodospirillaceae bacterium]MBT5457740.1 DNA polymerase III subunit gamma/tau [Rhodospirillaceae bacterium]